LKTSFSFGAGEGDIKKGGNILRQGTGVKYGFIKEHCCQHSVALMCRLFYVSRGGCYAWLHFTPGNRFLANQKPDEEIASVFIDNKSRYVSPRITKELNKKEIDRTHKRVAKR